MPELRNHLGHPAVAPQRRLITPPETARLGRVSELEPGQLTAGSDHAQTGCSTGTDISRRP